MAMRTTFSRNGLGWAFGPTRSLDEFAPDVMRNEYDPVTGELLGTLIEEQHTNLLPYSHDVAAMLSTAPWAAGAGDITTANDPVWGLVSSVSQGSGFGNQSEDLGVGVGWVVFFATGVSHIVMNMRYNGDVRYNWVEISLNDGAVTNTGGSTDPDFLGIYELNDGWKIATFSMSGGTGYHLYASAGTGYNAPYDANKRLLIAHCQHEARLRTSPIRTFGSETTRAADFLDAPGANNEYGPGLHTWRNAVRMSRDPGEPTIIGSAEHRIYASNGRLHLDGPGTLWQPPGEHEPGALVPFYWSVQFPGATPDFALGRDIGDANFWNGHLLDIVPYPRIIPESEITAELGL